MKHGRQTSSRTGGRAGVLAVLAAVLVSASAVGAHAQGPPAGAPSLRPFTEERGDWREHLIADLVYLRLAASPSLARATFTPAVDGRQVILRGVVPDVPSRERALRIAAWTFGVREVRDELRVDADSPELRPLPDVDDAVLARQTAEKLADLFPAAHAEGDWLFGWEVEGTSWELDVDVDAGAVTLTGSVPECWQVRRLVEAARAVPGARTIRTRLYADGDPGYDFGPYGPYPSLPLPCPYDAPLLSGDGSHVVATGPSLGAPGEHTDRFIPASGLPGAWAAEGRPDPWSGTEAPAVFRTAPNVTREGDRP